MKRCPDNKINASFIDILRIKWLVRLQASKHRPIIGPHPVEQTAFRRGIPLLAWLAQASAY